MPEVRPQNGDGVLSDRSDVPGKVNRDLPRVDGADPRCTNHTSSTSMISVDVLQHNSILDHKLEVIEFADKLVWLEFELLKSLLQVTHIRWLTGGECDFRPPLFVEVLALDHQRLTLII